MYGVKLDRGSLEGNQGYNHCLCACLLGFDPEELQELDNEQNDERRIIGALSLVAGNPHFLEVEALYAVLKLHHREDSASPAIR